MKNRQRIFSILAALVLLWMLVTLSSVDDAVDEVTTTGAEDRTELEQAATEAGATVGAGIGGLAVLCVGGFLFISFALLAWRNGVGLKQEEQHTQMLAAVGGDDGREKV